jgi:regulator of protease activity HflC (stomatin/prohibitin superfamily)
VTPGTIKTLISATGGGLGTFVNQMADAVIAMSSDDEDLRAKSMPVVNRFYGEVDEDATIRSAAERRRKVDELVEEVKRQRKIGIEPELDAEANRLLDLAKLQERQQKELTRMRKEEVEIIRSDRPDAEKKAERKRLQAERDRLAIEFNKEFLQGMKQP